MGGFCWLREHPSAVPLEAGGVLGPEGRLGRAKAPADPIAALTRAGSAGFLPFAEDSFAVNQPWCV